MTLSVIGADYLVASGSLARGLPADFYARVARQAKAQGSRVIVDSSGPGLEGALAEGVFMVKPSRGELEALLGRKAGSPADEEALARELVDSGKVEIVVITACVYLALSTAVALATSAYARRVKLVER